MALVRAADPERTEIQGKFLRFFVARASEGVNLTLLVSCHLRDDMSSGAEAVDAEPLAASGFDQATVTNQSGA